MHIACHACAHPDRCRIALRYAVFCPPYRKHLTIQPVLRYKPCLHSNVLRGEVAQLGEHRLRKAGAGSSSLLFSTTASKRVAIHVATLFFVFFFGGQAARCLARSPIKQRLASGGSPLLIPVRHWGLCSHGCVTTWLHAAQASSSELPPSSFTPLCRLPAGDVSFFFQPLMTTPEMMQPAPRMVAKGSLSPVRAPKKPPQAGSLA